MALAVSCAVNFFTINKLIEWKKAPMKAKIIPNEIIPTPGWTIMSIPINPTKIAAILLNFITSPKIKSAKIVTKIGVVKLIAVALAKGIKIKAENYGICPDWHLGAGGKTWIFVDEITIK